MTSVYPIFCIFFLNLFLIISLRNLTLSCVCVLQAQGASYWWDLCACKSKLVPATAVRPGVWVSLICDVSYGNESGVNVSYASKWRSLTSSHGVRTQKLATRVTGVIEALSAGSWSGTSGDSPCARCWLLGLWASLSSPVLMCMGCACAFTQGKPQAGPEWE